MQPPEHKGIYKWGNKGALNNCTFHCKRKKYQKIESFYEIQEKTIDLTEIFGYINS